MNQNVVKTIIALKSDLFYQIESKFGAKVASEYPSIIQADELLNNLIKPSDCGDWLHTERVKQNGDNFCPICGEQLIFENNS